VEIKRGPVTRDTVAQALDYAASLASIDAGKLQDIADGYLKPRNKSIQQLLEKRRAVDALDIGQRQLMIFLVGIGASPGLARVTNFLARYEVPVSIVLYDAFVRSDGARILSREVTDAELVSPSTPARAGVTLDDLTRQAELAGIESAFKAMLQAGLDMGLYPRLWKTSVMLAPQSNKTRALYTIWAPASDGRLQEWIGGSVFAEFSPVSASSVTEHLGPEGWRFLDAEQASAFADGLRKLLAQQTS
jgi:hypothetical protein